MVDSMKLISALDLMADTMIEQRDFLNELDGALGDADFGTTVTSAFQILKEQLPTLDGAPSLILKKAGMTLLKNQGGASGPIFGTAFREAGKAAGDAEALTPELLARMMQSALDGVKRIGGAKVGDKTLVDAFEPAVAAFIAASENGQTLPECGAQAAVAAQNGVEATKDMVAAKGRAHYVGERGLGHPDAGATAVAMLFTAFQR